MIPSMRKTVVEGLRLIDRIPDVPNRAGTSDRILELKGASFNIPISRTILSQHILFTGGIGTGKTNAIFQIVDQLVRGMTKDDVMIIFDSKGDFLEEFGNKIERPAIISNDQNANVYWNILNEALVDGDSEDVVENNLMELATSLFEDTRQGDSKNQFFVDAAKNVFYGVMLGTYIQNKNIHLSNKSFINNKTLMNRCDSSIEELIGLFNGPRCASKLSGLNEYLINLQGSVAKITEQGSSVIATMRNKTLDIFKGNFAKIGDFSVRDFVRKKGGRTLFIEYDVGQGSSLTAVYKTMVDLAIKEALSRTRSKGNVYFVIDEFRLLPKMDHMDAGVNLGRSLGTKFIVAMQNLKQIESAYGESEAKSILSGFVTTVNFRTTDCETREYIKSQFGKQTYTLEIQTISGGKEVRESDVVTDSDILTLNPGEAIISIPQICHDPVRFRFRRFQDCRS